MHHMQRLCRVWNWLPAFRVVAETEHLPTASGVLHVTPSALSRSIKHLEEELGQQLFLRVGRRLELSPSGHELLRALRESMTRLDRGLDAASSSQFLGPIRISAPEPFTSAFVLSAVERMMEAHPLIVPQLSALAAPTACGWVADRRVDVAVLDEPVEDDALEVHRLGPLSYGIYCGQGHPLFTNPTDSMEEVLRHGFVSPPASTVHPWPRELDRDVTMVVSDMHLALEACVTGRFLALLSDVVVRRYRGGAVRRLPVDVESGCVAYAVCRAGSAEGPVGALLGELRAAFSSVSRG